MTLLDTFSFLHSVLLDFESKLSLDCSLIHSLFSWTQRTTNEVHGKVFLYSNVCVRRDRKLRVSVERRALFEQCVHRERIYWLVVKTIMSHMQPIIMMTVKQKGQECVTHVSVPQILRSAEFEEK